jgi:hypothetical protein
MIIVHLPSAHQSDDTRIVIKECRSLAAAGHELMLAIPDGLVLQRVFWKRAPTLLRRRKLMTESHVVLTAPVLDLTPQDVDSIVDELQAYHAMFSPLF